MKPHLVSVAITIEVTSRHMECTRFNLDYSQMPAVALQQLKVVVEPGLCDRSRRIACVRESMFGLIVKNHTGSADVFHMWENFCCTQCKLIQM